MDNRDIAGPVLLSALAGSATGVGGLLVYCFRDVPSDQSISLALSYAAGVMICVSVFDLFIPMAFKSMSAFVFSSGCALLGAALCGALAQLPIPEPDELLAVLTGIGAASREGSKGSSGKSSPLADAGGSPPTSASSSSIARDAQANSNSAHSRSSSSSSGTDAHSVLPLISPHSSASSSSSAGHDLKGHAAWRVGMLLALILTLHNLPEGLAVAAGAQKSPQLGITLCTAIFLHNVAEGYVISVPLLRGLPDKRIAVGIAAVTGLSEPLGALLGVLVLNKAVGPTVVETAIDASLSAVAGIMTMVSIRELLPLSLRHAKAHGPQGRRLVAAGFAFGALSIGATLFVV